MHNLNAFLNWTQEAEQAFITLKQKFATAAELALPNYTLPFYLDVSGTGDVMPPGIRQTVLEEAHGVGHVGAKQMVRNLENW